MVNVSIIALNCILFLRNDANQLLKLLLGKNTRKNKGSVFRSIRGKTGEETILTALNSIILSYVSNFIYLKCNQLSFSSLRSII